MSQKCGTSQGIENDGSDVDTNYKATKQSDTNADTSEEELYSDNDDVETNFASWKMEIC